jgi:outer membrane receptor protein involved in Fe transport
MDHRWERSLAILLICVAPSAGAGAAPSHQATRLLPGVVIDASGAPVAGASVLLQTAAMHTRTTETGTDGRFRIEAESGIDATLRVWAKGFAEAVTEVSSDRASVTIVLRPQPLFESVTVTAAMSSELDTAASASVISSAELLTSAAGALDDVLRNTPGFSLFRRSSSRTANPTTQGVTLRGISGSGASRTLVVADGWALNDPFGSWVYWNRIPVAAVDKVQVLRGPAGDLYGADALGGVVQVLTFSADRPRLRVVLDGASHNTVRASGFGGRQVGAWAISASAELAQTGGVYVVASGDRGAVDAKADNDYRSGFASVLYSRGTWRTGLRTHIADEQRSNGTRLQVNDTNWGQLSGDINGALAGGYWTFRVARGRQDYFQTFTALAADRQTERLTTEQRVPGESFTAGSQWTRTWKRADVLAGFEGRKTTADIDEIGYSPAGVPLPSSLRGAEDETYGVFGRIHLGVGDNVSVGLGIRGDRWQSQRALEFFSPRASVTWRPTEMASLQFSVSRGHRTPTLNELYRGFRVGNVQTNANPFLEPERLTSIEGGALVARGRASARVVAFHNVLNRAISNVTLSSGPTLTLRERQNTDEVRAYGVEVEADLRPRSGVTVSIFGAFTSAHFVEAPKQPAIRGHRIPQVPPYHFGAGVIAGTPRIATVSLQGRFVGNQFDDDLNQLTLQRYVVVDGAATRPLMRGLQLFLAIENLLDVEYDVGRAPVRSIGWPRTVRAGVRLFRP